jgi:Reverse transcriptase (RNA-dependent DNA polymerase).
VDCYSGFWHINVKGEHKERTGYSVPFGHFEFYNLLFGLSNSPLKFQRLLDVVFKNLVGTECWDFIDDVIIFSKSAQEYAQRPENVLQRFHKASLQLH